MRKYFYNIDLSGNLILDNTVHTDEKFLNFFFSRLKINDTGDHPDYDFVSPCGDEMNFTKAADTPIVFKSLQDGRLSYAPGLSVDFIPESLRFSDSGTLYHPAPLGKFGRLKAGLLLELGRKINPWGPYFALEEKGKTIVIEPMEKKDSYVLIRPRAENGCFGCGGGHPHGLSLNFIFDPEKKTAQGWIVPDSFLQGGHGWMHGGFISLLLDEVMAKVLTSLDIKAPTVNLNVNFRKPCRLGQTLEIRGYLEEIKGKKNFLRGEVLDVTGEPHILLADAKALFIRVPAVGW